MLCVLDTKGLLPFIRKPDLYIGDEMDDFLWGARERVCRVCVEGACVSFRGLAAVARDCTRVCVCGCMCVSACVVYPQHDQELTLFLPHTRAPVAQIFLSTSPRSRRRRLRRRPAAAAPK